MNRTRHNEGDQTKIKRKINKIKIRKMKKKKKSMKCNDDADNAGDAYEKEKIMINYSEQKKKYEVDKRLQASS